MGCDPDGKNHCDHWVTNDQSNDAAENGTGHKSGSHPVEWPKHDPSLPQANSAEFEVEAFDSGLSRLSSGVWRLSEPRCGLLFLLPRPLLRGFAGGDAIAAEGQQLACPFERDALGVFTGPQRSIGFAVGDVGSVPPRSHGDHLP